MATAIQRLARDLCSMSPSIFHQLRQIQRLPRVLGTSPYLIPSQCFCKAVSPQNEESTPAAEAQPRYIERPWEYLESEEYIAKYGASAVWAGYRRNHKGGIPPQKTRKTCIRGDKICGNPCPICRDPNAVLHHQNVKLLQQFISPHTGIVYDSTHTGLCVKQQKKLNEAISKAKDIGFLPFQIPHVKFTEEEFYSSHDAVGRTPPPPSLTSGDTWYKWYSEIMPDEKEVAKVKKTYKAYLK